MTLDEFKRHKIELETNIRMMLDDLLIEFREDTDYTPKSISVELLDITELGQSPKNYCIGEVEIEIDI